MLIFHRQQRVGTLESVKNWETATLRRTSVISTDGGRTHNYTHPDDTLKRTMASKSGKPQKSEISPHNAEKRHLLYILRSLLGLWISVIGLVL
jgi:hypothetical protein